jgi:hypothetical protein
MVKKYIVKLTAEERVELVLLNDSHDRRDDSQKPCFEKTIAKPYS